MQKFSILYQQSFHLLYILYFVQIQILFSRSRSFFAIQPSWRYINRPGLRSGRPGHIYTSLEDRSRQSWAAVSRSKAWFHDQTHKPPLYPPLGKKVGWFPELGRQVIIQLRTISDSLLETQNPFWDRV